MQAAISSSCPQGQESLYSAACTRMQMVSGQPMQPLSSAAAAVQDIMGLSCSTLINLA